MSAAHVDISTHIPSIAVAVLKRFPDTVCCLPTAIGKVSQTLFASLFQCQNSRTCPSLKIAVGVGNDTLVSIGDYILHYIVCGQANHAKLIRHTIAGAYNIAIH